MAHPRVSPLEDQLVVTGAAQSGFHLVQCETDTGQLVWEWRRGNEPRPRFVTRRVAIQWMTELLEREHRRFGSKVGRSSLADIAGVLRAALEDGDGTTVRSDRVRDGHQP
jgi:hypothetical protein